jgi:hypothetical protein
MSLIADEMNIFFISSKLAIVVNHSCIYNLQPFVVEYAITSCYHGVRKDNWNDNHKSNYFGYKLKTHGLLWIGFFVMHCH